MNVNPYFTHTQNEFKMDHKLRTHNGKIQNYKHSGKIGEKLCGSGLGKAG